MNVTLSRKRFAKHWWWSKRCKYNNGLFIAGFIAFLLYCILGPIIIAPHEEFEETVFEMVFQGGAYFFAMLIANAFYTLGWAIDILFNKENSQRFRDRLRDFGGRRDRPYLRAGKRDGRRIDRIRGRRFGHRAES